MENKNIYAALGERQDTNVSNTQVFLSVFFKVFFLKMCVLSKLLIHELPNFSYSGTSADALFWGCPFKHLLSTGVAENVCSCNPMEYVMTLFCLGYLKEDVSHFHFLTLI